jgi:hypothetical protein
MDEKPLAAIPQRRAFPPFKGNFSISFALNDINRQINNIIALLKALKPCLLCLTFILFHSAASFALTDNEIFKYQSELKDESVGERIALWAEKFIGAPYDKDPLGEYVSRAAIVADERVDCMYLTFRAVELAMSTSPGEAIEIALNKRFHSRGIISEGRVVNYEDRFEYGEDMIYSGKWGKDITAQIGRVKRTIGSRGKDFIEFLPPDELKAKINALKSGDIVFFIKAPKKRSRKEELVAHMGIIKAEDKKTYLIHAGGIKGRGGYVKKVLLSDYIRKMPFIGAKIARFD